ncbi:peptidyl-prolyl cis-trans isomerase CYP37, chloroplastic [Tanacetum coccineum]
MATRGRKKAIAEPAPPARDPRDVETIERLQQQIQELEFQQLKQDSPAEETKTESNVWDDGSEDVNPFGGGNPLLTKELESEPIWDIGDEQEEYPFVNKHSCFQEEPIMLGEEESCPVYDTDNEEEEDGDKEEVIYADYEEAPVFDDDQYEEEIMSGDVGKRFVGKGFVDNYLNFQKDEKECDHSFIFKEDIGSVKTMMALQYFPTIEDPSIRRALFEVLQRILMGTDVGCSDHQKTVTKLYVPVLERAITRLGATISVILVIVQLTSPVPLSGWDPSLLPPAQAVLYSPDTKVPRTGELALRKAIPANTNMKSIQNSLEELSYLLRIPQRKPYGTMESNVKKALKIAVDEKESILASLPADQKEKGSEIYTTLIEGKGGLQTLLGYIKDKDPDRVSIALASSLGVSIALASSLDSVAHYRLLGYA